MTTQNPLEVLQNFSPRAADVTNQVTAGSNQITAGMNRELLGSQIQGQNFINKTNEQSEADQKKILASETNIQNTAANLTRLNTALDQGATAEQVASLLQQNILRAQQQGGNGADSQEALQALQTGGLEAVKNLAGQATAVFQQQGILKAPEFEKVETAEGIGEFNPNTGRIQIADGAPITTAQWKAQQEERFDKIADASKLVKDKQTQSDNLRGEVNKLAKELQFTDTFTAFNRIAASNDGTPAGDLALIFNYMKMLDPGSTVREGEFATAQNAAGVPDRVRNAVNQLISGERLSDAQRKNFTEQAKLIFDKAKGGFESTVAPILNIGKSRGLTKADILGEGFFESFTVVDDNPQTEVAAKPVIVGHPTFGDVTEEDIQQTMTENGMTREQVIQALGS